jgi:vacuolar-type H+-ATPase subunit I/STV1
MAQIAQGQMMQAALNTAQQQQQQSQHQAPAAGTLDLASVLAKIQSLEKEKADMRAQLESTSARLSKLQESKRAEMEQMMNSTISKWLENLSTTDAAAKDQLKDGLNRLVQSGDESGVWNVIACASSNWISNVNQIEQLTQQLNEYREKERLLSGGIFQSEESRVSGASAIPPVPGEKRKADGISQAHGASSGMAGDIWSEFQTMMMSSGGNMGYDYGIMVSGNRGVPGQ